MSTPIRTAAPVEGPASSAPIALDTSERAQCAALARWLDTSPVLASLSLFVVVIAAFYAVTSMLIPSTTYQGIFSNFVLLLALVERYCALRLRFDRGLYADLASGRIPSLTALDSALAALGLRKAAVPPRTLADRIRGTQRLWWAHAAVVGKQVVFCALAYLTRPGGTASPH